MNDHDDAALNAAFPQGKKSDQDILVERSARPLPISTRSASRSPPELGYARTRIRLFRRDAARRSEFRWVTYSKAQRWPELVLVSHDFKLPARILYAIHHKDGMNLDGPERHSRLRRSENDFSNTTPGKDYEESNAISDLPLASLVAWLGERHLAPVINNSIRRNKDMILNGINEVSKETGIHPSSLRRWEGLGFIAPGRISFVETWVRVYSDEDVEMLKRVKRLMEDGYRLRAAFDKATEESQKDS